MYKSKVICSLKPGRRTLTATTSSFFSWALCTCPRDAADINQFVGLIENRDAVLDIYPNPSSDYIQINSPRTTNASLYNMNGSLVKKINLTSGVNVFNLGQLSSGSYMLYSDGNSYSIIVE